MRIGELSRVTGVSRRLLRYYEQQGLIVPDRSTNGYRDYDERYADRVKQIRGLLAAGLSTRLIKQILPCLDKPRSIHFPDATPEMLALLTSERDKLTDRIEVLTRNRNAMTEYLTEVERHRAPDVPGQALAAPGQSGSA
ncbi:MerR family transcriptional regulator [Streptomyces sp. NBC_00328]|uniref:MerR family transcriptional regulator n=1 Tax=Streptomyces sp. NBC_00328 TaxID=2903646 RepID=UPI002E2A192C|nr:MerR family transcriptional regulator [Streptomyces sp. NBC_00328]